MAFNPKDYYFKKAKTQNYVARSIFKLEEIDKRFKLFKAGQRVLDLGACPGSWSQYASQKVGPNGRVVGVDLKPITLTLSNAVFLQMDILNEDLPATFAANSMPTRFDLVISDMAPNTTGIILTDQVRSFELCEMALMLARRYLKKGGHFVCKMFHSSDFETFRRNLNKSFHRVDILKPRSTRKESKEIFFIAQQFLGSKS